jgi:hypothetical protein
MFQGYTYDEALAIITYYFQRLHSLTLETYCTPNRHLVIGKVDGFVALPFDPATEAYEGFMMGYQLAAPFQQEWIQAKRQEGHRWLPFVIVQGQYLPLVPIAVELHIWDEGWRA